MIYLSRLLLNPRHRAVRYDLADCQRLHRTILHAFPAKPAGVVNAREHFGLLYRLDHDARLPDRLALLVQSSVPPDWALLDQGYLLDTGGKLENPACKPIDDQLGLIHTGMMLRFRLRANPTRKIPAAMPSDPRRRNGMRVELQDEEKQVAWLIRKGTQHGFDLYTSQADAHRPNIRVVPEDKLIGKRGGQGMPGQTEQQERAGRLTFGSVLFEGALRVTDTDAFRAAVEHGIGSGKAYGFGMLSLARY